MNEKILEVGTMYLTHDGVGITKIVGKVDSNTREYRTGARFFGDNNELYEENGTIVLLIIMSIVRVDGEDPEITRKRVASFHVEKKSLIKRAPPSLVRNYTYSDSFRLSLESLKTSSRYLTSKHPSFALVLGELYVDRTGRLILLESIVHGNDEIDDRFVGSDGSRYTKQGFADHLGNKIDDFPSMFDLVYQRI